MLTILMSEMTEPHAWAGINPYAIGATAFAILMSLLIGLVMFGAGRDHS